PPPEKKEPDLPLPAWRDSKTNKLEELNEPLYWAALKKNQLVTPKVAGPLQAFLRQRERQYERIVVDNIDLMRKVLEGAIDKAHDVPRNPEGRDGSLTKLLQILKPLVGDNIREIIKQKGLLSRIQSEHQDKVKRAYTEERGRDVDASIPPLAAGATPEQQKERTSKLTKEKMRLQLYDFIDEATWTYAWLLNDIAMHWDETLAKTEFSEKADENAAIKAKLNAAIGDVKAAKDDKGRVAAMKKLVLLITPEEERTLLQALIAGRPTAPEAPAEKPAEEAGKAAEAAK
ncbi:MAG: hypothetical protein AABZ53_01055, partial [Planctomycetota bacterium]